MRWASSIASAAVETGADARSTGTPARSADTRARTLSPVRIKVSGDGPTHVRPASTTAWAKTADSDKNP